MLLPHVNTLLGSGRRRRRSSGAHAKDGDDVEIDRWSTSPAMAPQDSAGEPQSSGPVASHPSQGDLGRAGAHGAGEEEEREGVSKKTRPLYRIIEMVRFLSPPLAR